MGKGGNIWLTLINTSEDFRLFLTFGDQQMAEVSSKMTWLKRGGRVRPGDGKKEPSLASSMESLTQSQLNLAIMDMLNLGQNWNRCEEVCRGKL